MAKTTTSSEKAAFTRASCRKHADRVFTCACGRTFRGNGYGGHIRACLVAREAAALLPKPIPIPDLPDAGCRVLPIAGVDGYAVGEDGSIWSRKRLGKWHRMIHQTRKGADRDYPRAHLRKGGRNYSPCVHFLVISTFNGPRPPGMVCRHLDGNCRNPRLENLRWGLPLQNVHDQIAHGTMTRGMARAASKLTDAQVLEINSRPTTTLDALAQEFGVSKTTISRIRCEDGWKHLWNDPSVATPITKRRLTAGPWNIKIISHGFYQIVAQSDRPEVVAEVIGKSNARLVAAAPHLLALCRAAYEVCLDKKHLLDRSQLLAEQLLAAIKSIKSPESYGEAGEDEQE